MDKLKKYSYPNSEKRQEAERKLQDLSPALRDITIDKQGWCYIYRDPKELGKVMYNNFVEFNKQKARNKDNIFAFSDDLTEKGLMSQLQGFQVLAMLIEDFGADLDSKKMLEILDDILNTIGTAEKNRFDATPYLPGSKQFDKDNYLDSMTWFISCACSVFRLMINSDFDIGPERLDRIVSLFKYGIDYINESFIGVNESITSEKKPDAFVCGWNYTKGCKAPSLYFTYSATETLIDIYSTFKNVIVTAETEFVKNKIEEKFKEIEKSDESLDKERLLDEKLKKQAQIEEKNQDALNRYSSNDAKITLEKKLFSLINCGYAPLAKDSPYAKFEELCKKAAKNIWYIVKDKLTSGFFAYDLVSDISLEVLEQSITSDALFSSLFAINAVINAGLDEDADDKINYYTLNGSAQYEEAISTYDEMRSTIRLGYDYVYQTYDKLNQKKKAYRVDEFVVSFNEAFDESQMESIKEMRKARIRVFSLMPLLVKTKTLLGEFLIQYPQYDMQLYLEEILKRRYVDGKGNPIWVWEKDGYSSSSNYYYVSALSDFFEYYSEYELKYSENANKNKNREEEIKKQYYDELITGEGEINQLRQQLQGKSNEIDALNNKVKELENKYKDYDLKQAITDFIYNTVKDRMASMLAEVFTGMASDITEDVKQRFGLSENDADNDNHADFKKSVHALGLSLITNQLFQVMHDDEDRKVDIKAYLPKLAGETYGDLEKLLYIYVKQIFDRGESEIVSTDGYKGLLDLLQSEDEKNRKTKNENK